MAGFVVRARTELQARELAAELAGVERFGDRKTRIERIPSPWMDHDLVSWELTRKGTPA